MITVYDSLYKQWPQSDFFMILMFKKGISEGEKERKKQ